MDARSYRDRVETRVTADGYEAVAAEAANPFAPVWYKQDDDPTIGRTKVFVTVVDPDAPTEETLEATAEAFRTLLASAAGRTDGAVENRFGYIVFTVHSPERSLVEFATEGYTVADRRTNVFPLVYDLDAERLHTHAVPRLKGRGFYEKQKLDAEELLSP